MASPYTVLIDGVPVQCETADAALDLIRQHGGATPTTHTTPRMQHTTQHNGTRWTDQRVTEFFKLIDGNQRKLIDALLATEDGRTDTQLRQLLNLSSGSALGGVIGGLWKNAKKVGADPHELYIRKPITIGDKRGLEYSLNEGFRKAAAARGRSAK